MRALRPLDFRHFDAAFIEQARRRSDSIESA
jgi:hypothetical protein